MTESPFDKLNYPCDFTIKVMGENSPKMTAEVLSILSDQLANPDAELIKKASSNNRYLSLSIPVRAISKDQLLLIYQALKNCSYVKFVL